MSLFRQGTAPIRHQPSGSINEDTQQRIVMLYNSGQSIESITREVGRARHLVVHTLQSRGVFGTRRTKPDYEESRNEPLAVEDLKEELIIEERKLDPVAVEGSEPEIAIDETSRKMTRLRKSKAPAQLKSVIVEKPKVKPHAAEKASVTGRWSPQVVDALLRVVALSEIDPEMSIGEVKRMVSGARHKDGRKR
jgi:hypothetical protein